MPHHGVLKPNSKKLRVVFNTSQKGSNGKSLNDYLLPGPKLQGDVTLILTRWRFFKFAFTADIIKMFRQFDVHESDLRYQHILWRADPLQPMQDFCLTTVTYGTTAAPFLANCTMLQLAHEGESTHPKAAQIIRQQTYVDDTFAGVDSIEKALIVKDQLISLLKSAQLKLGKWSANSPDLLINNDDSNERSITTHTDDFVFTLGVRWQPRSDYFHFIAHLSASRENYTKRRVLSDTAKLFDPLGWLTPIIIVAKIILRDMWLHGADWDATLPEELVDRWVDFRDALPLINLIRVPRWTNVHEKTQWQLHGFADSSERAYGAVVYAVTPGTSAIILTAKSRVAPKKEETLPRLELCAAVLLARLVKHLLDGLPHLPHTVNL
ncbi:hypothetical protein TKK_0015649 [Trichogramma kaykai]|uniref:Reverse transcriptase domain-containing protein n=2 Tax=Trichogramma kaykai TaxID=54128 RepID=A0ABD2WBE0_9HYME